MCYNVKLIQNYGESMRRQFELGHLPGGVLMNVYVCDMGCGKTSNEGTGNEKRQRNSEHKEKLQPTSPTLLKMHIKILGIGRR